MIEDLNCSSEGVACGSVNLYSWAVGCLFEWRAHEQSLPLLLLLLLLTCMCFYLQSPLDLAQEQMGLTFSTNRSLAVFGA